MGGLKSFMKKIISIFLTAIMCLSVFTGCGNGCGIGLRLYENDIFIYTVGYDSNKVSILGLTDKGREQEYLIVPEKIEGKEVFALSCDGYDEKKIEEKFGDKKYSGLRSDNIKKMFVVPTVIVKYGAFFQYANDSIEVFYISNGVQLQENAHHYIYYYTKDNEMVGAGRVANISYYYNYEQAPNNGYYWIDNYNYGEKITYIPEQPSRDGYTFEGWYKEEECINRWNFAIDNLPSEQLDHDGNVVYQETKLYAKWIKN